MTGVTLRNSSPIIFELKDTLPKLRDQEAIEVLMSLHEARASELLFRSNNRIQRTKSDGQSFKRLPQC